MSDDVFNEHLSVLRQMLRWPATNRTSEKERLAIGMAVRELESRQNSVTVIDTAKYG